MLVLVAAQRGDSTGDVERLANRIANLRIFEDEQGKMNLACAQVAGSFLVVSNFTVAGNAHKGRRPSFDQAAPYEEGERLYERFVQAMGALGLPVATGVYGAEMQVTLTNDGPITFLVESGHG